MAGGRPRKFETPERMQEAIDAYFAKCDKGKELKTVSNGKVVTVTQPIPYTISGLCLALGIDRRTLLNYEKHTEYQEFFHIVMDAKTKVLNCLEEGALLGEYNANFVAFQARCNFNYKEPKDDSDTPDGGEDDRGAILQRNLEQAKQQQEKGEL